MKQEHIEILLEDLKGKFELVLEGHDSIRQEFRVCMQEMNEKIELNSFLIQGVNKKIDDVDVRLGKKIDAVAADLTAHRADTESHRKVYKASEE